MSQNSTAVPWGEREYWQGRFNAGDTPWELGCASTVVLEALDVLRRDLGFDLTGAKVLVPGCGTGSDAIELAKLGAKVLAADWSEVAIGSLKARFAKVSDEGCVKGDLECLKGDLFGFEPTPVDLVCEHTFFCAIDPAIRAQYVSTMARWIRPGGYLFGNFFILSEADAASLPGLAMGRDGKGPPFASTLREIEALFSASFEKVVLRPSSAPDPKRRPGMEWVGIFRRKGES